MPLVLLELLVVVLVLVEQVELEELVIHLL
jgi:hypothetical protein